MLPRRWDSSLDDEMRCNIGFNSWFVLCDGLLNDPNDTGTGKPRRQVVFDKMQTVPWAAGPEAAYCRTMGSPSGYDAVFYGSAEFSFSKRRKKNDQRLFAKERKIRGI